jgi:O-antigen/teichoic acid export membrane protein
VAATAGLVVLAPALLRQVVGVAFGGATVGFAAAVVINSFSQLRVAELQGAGRSRRAVLSTAFGAAVSIPLFFAAARAFGAEGLLIAWLAKSVLELAVLSLGGNPRTKAGDGTA